MYEPDSALLRHRNGWYDQLLRIILNTDKYVEMGTIPSTQNQREVKKLKQREAWSLKFGGDSKAWETPRLQYICNVYTTYS